MKNKLMYLLSLMFLLVGTLNVSAEQIEITDAWRGTTNIYNRVNELDGTRTTIEDWHTTYVVFGEALSTGDTFNFNGKERWGGDKPYIWVCPASTPTCSRVDSYGEIQMVGDNTWSDYSITLTGDIGSIVYLRNSLDMRYDYIWGNSVVPEVSVNLELPNEVHTKMIGDNFTLSCTGGGQNDLTLLPILKKNNEWIIIPTLPTENLQADSGSYECTSDPCNFNWTITAIDNDDNQEFGCMVVNGNNHTDTTEVDIIGNTNEFTINVNNDYKKNSIVAIDLYSTLASTPHKILVFSNESELICNNSVPSNPIPNTKFTTECDITGYNSQDDAQVLIYSNVDSKYNNTANFNIVEKIQNSSVIDISSVYFSAQVLQGGSTEIFAIIETNGTTPNIQFSLKFPDNTTRQFSMTETVNENEYKAFITDTFQTGDVFFNIYTTIGEYFAEYESSYFVAQYNIDFVDLVNQVGEVLQVRFQTPTANILGTYYEVGDEAKVIGQLSSQGLPLNNATCYASIYYPDNTLLVRNTYMQYIPNSDGLYVYDITVPDFIGVYPISVVCDYETYDETYLIEGFGLYNGTIISGQLNSTYYADDDEMLMESQFVTGTNHSYLEADFMFNVSDNIINESTFMIYWKGLCEKTGAEGHLNWWNTNTSQWEDSENIITHSLGEQSFDSPTFSGNYVNSTGWVKVKFNGTAPVTYGTTNVFSDDFEDGTLPPFIATKFTDDITIDVRSGSLNGTYNGYLSGDSDAGTRDIGTLSFSFSTLGINDTMLYYTRESFGAESTDDYSVYIYANKTINKTVTDDFESGDFNGGDGDFWADDEWWTSGNVIITSASTPHSGIYHLDIRSDDSYVDRGVDFTGSTCAVVSFWAKASSIENNEYAHFRIETESNANDYTIMETWTDGDDDNIWRYYEYDIYDHENITLGSNLEISFWGDMSGNGDHLFVDDLKVKICVNGNNTLEEWSGNSYESRKSYDLSEYDNLNNVTVYFYNDVDHNSDYFQIDDVLVAGDTMDGAGFYTDVFVLKNLGIAGVVQNVRGGGEFNVKDRLSNIEATLSGISQFTGYETTTYTDVSVENYNTNETVLLATRLTYKLNGSETVEVDGDCTMSIYSNHNDTLFGTPILEEELMTEFENGIYYYTFTTPNEGIYSVESNCENDNRHYYGFNQFRVGLSVSVEGEVQAIVQNLDDITDAIDSLFKMEVFSTDYEVGDNARTFTSIVKGDEYINNATCYLDIDHPSSSYDDNQFFIENAYMTPIGHNGLYYYDYIAPNQTGIYMVTATCDLNVETTSFYPYSNSLIDGVVNYGDISDITSDDGNYFETTEQLITNRLYDHQFSFNLSSITNPNSTLNNIAINFIGYNDRDNYDEAEDMYIQIYNYTSTSWETLINVIPPQLSKSTDITVGNSLASNSDYFNNDILQIRIYDEDRTSDNDKNEIDIDKLELVLSVPIQIPIDIKTGGGELNIRNHFTDLNNSIFSDISELLLLLEDIQTQQVKQDQFTDEQIYLITDAITSLDTLKQDVAVGDVNQAQATQILNDYKEVLTEEDIKLNTIRVNSIGTPNELFIVYENEQCVTNIMNEGDKTGTYDVTLSVDGFFEETHKIKLRSGEQKYLYISLSELKEGRYKCSATSIYDSGKSVASINVNHIHKTDTETQLIPIINKSPIKGFFNFFNILIGVSMILMLVNAKVWLTKEEKENGKENINPNSDVIIFNDSSNGCE